MPLREKKNSRGVGRRREQVARRIAKKTARRIFILGGLQLALIGGIVARMRKLQVQEKDKFLLLAEENRINIRLITPERGFIYDRNGFVLAGNEQNYRAVLRRSETKDVAGTLADFGQLIGFDNEKLAALEKEIMRHNAFVPVMLADKLSWEDFSKIAVNAPALPGVFPEVGLSRIYPLGSDSVHFLGYVGFVSDYDLLLTRDRDPLLRIPKFQIGKLNIEKHYEQNLRGKAGSRHIEVNALGREMRELERHKAKMGDAIQLTIDAPLQSYVQARIKEQNAAAVVIDTENGDLLAIGSDPNFNPNKFVHGISVNDYNALLENPRKPLFNKAIQGTYPPGSVFKIVTSLAALEEGLIDAEEEIKCTGFIENNKRKFHCWKKNGHGLVKLNASISQSCDVYYYTLAERVGIEKMAIMAHKLGLGEKFDLPFSAVSQGLIPTKKWKRRHKKTPWFVGDSFNASIGQGYVLSSALQLAVMMARVASGKVIFPRIVGHNNSQTSQNIAPEILDIKPQNLALVRQGLFDVVNGRFGTARAYEIIDDKYRMAGKTGTSQVRTISSAERARGIMDSEDIPFKMRDHALFVGYAPYDKPRYAVAVIGEHGGSGSRFAAPIVRDILLRAMVGGMPPLSAYPENQREFIRQQQEQLKLRKILPPKKGRSDRV